MIYRLFVKLNSIFSITHNTILNYQTSNQSKEKHTQNLMWQLDLPRGKRSHKMMAVMSFRNPDNVGKDDEVDARYVRRMLGIGHIKGSYKEMVVTGNGKGARSKIIFEK